MVNIKLRLIAEKCWKNEAFPKYMKKKREGSLQGSLCKAMDCNPTLSIQYNVMR